ncbi:fimbrial protein [Achromobacter sp. ACM02]|uniref:fimbrial protein n=1 Tax=Achromobacter sp. ACM02 TaxID=2769305 RepID=UPI0017860910|nr:fimbrial protein [Achromobacter sp. ACM02]MBD9383494.1 fimbrial protein [Achromobacter sp. ACM02]
MNKNTITKFALLATAAAISQTAWAEDGRINFIGEIVDAPCDVSPQATNLVVPLGKVSRTTLDGAVGKYSTPAQFELQLANCSATAKGASVTFTGTADTINTDTLAIGIGELGSATGVAVELRDSTQKKIKLGAESPEYTLRAGTNNLKFGAVYVSTANTVTVGPANATAQFTVNYK